MVNMSLNSKDEDKADKMIYERYHETLYSITQGDRDYEITSAGYGEWFHDCLPENKQSRILDVGCGDGKFLFFLQNKGYRNIEGLEISPQQAAEARKHIKCPIHLVDDTLAFFQEHESCYQMIVLNDVLEHIPKGKTVNFLKNILNALEPKGAVVINVPALATVTSIYCRYNDFTHEVIFTEQSLKQVLLLAGFQHIRFIKQNYLLKWRPRHLVCRLARTIWFIILRFIYLIESPSAERPKNFQTRLVVLAYRIA